MKGIIFRSDILQAKLKVLEKYGEAQTRRIHSLKWLNSDPDFVEFVRMEDGLAVFHKLRNSQAGYGDCFPNAPVKSEGADPNVLFYFEPRYQVGETVYIKEAWQIGAFKYQEWADINFKLDHTMQRVTWNDWLEKHTKYGGSTCSNGDKWRSPLFMPEWAARHFIKIKDVKAERLQEITEEDAIAEGCIDDFEIVYIHDQEDYRGLYAREHYARLWDSINPKYPWAS